MSIATVGAYRVNAAPFAGRRFIADNSVWQRANKAEISPVWSAALRNGQIATCPVVRLELLFSTRDLADFDQKLQTLDALDNYEIRQTEWDAAERAMRALLGASRHRAITFPDLLVAAVAEANRLGVLHYDGDFDLVRELGIFEIDSQWIVPRGSVS